MGHLVGHLHCPITWSALNLSETGLFGGPHAAFDQENALLLFSAQSLLHEYAFSIVSYWL